MATASNTKHWDDIYGLPLDKIPWQIIKPPKELVELIKTKQIRGGKALDVGCGTGNYSFYLAQNGFEVVGVDFSQKALDVANKNNEKLKLPVKFLYADVTKLETALSNAQFDFILDYSILHHIENLKDYAKQFSSLLKPAGKLLLVCYSDKDGFAQGKAATEGKYGNIMHYRTAEDIRRAYKDVTELEYKETTLGKKNHHSAHCFLFEKL